MAARSDDRGERDSTPNRQALTIKLMDVPGPAQITIDLSRAADSALTIPRSVGFLEIDAGPAAPAAAVSALQVQPQRIALELSAPLATLNVNLQIACDGPFLFGWLQVPEAVRARISTSVERLTIVGPGFWAVPVWEPARPRSDPARTEEFPSITHQRRTTAIGQVQASEAETVEPARKGRP